MKYAEQQERIEAAFRALPNAENPGGAISWRSLIPVIARELARMRRVDRVEVPPIYETAVERLAQTVGGVATKKELTQLFKALDEMHGPAVEAMGFRPGKPGKPGELAQLKLRALHGVTNVGSLRKAGRPEKAAARAIAIAAGEYYRHLTLKRPTVTVDAYASHEGKGDFVDLVRKIFGALGIKASAGPQAKVAEAALRQKYPCGKG